MKQIARSHGFNLPRVLSILHFELLTNRIKSIVQLPGTFKDSGRSETKLPSRSCPPKILSQTFYPIVHNLQSNNIAGCPAMLPTFILAALLHQCSMRKRVLCVHSDRGRLMDLLRAIPVERQLRTEVQYVQIRVISNAQFDQKLPVLRRRNNI
ncbi:hypothetical protein PUN28_018066 [Cardiocondyla obscurior]|uniref:Uncharacterized protein n=1 Tax=Cardiocondyla obscurior TaxID=286306 RepID=A0AAW2EJI6_9HYME